MYADHNGRHPLVLAVLHNNKTEVENLLNANYDLNTQFYNAPIVDWAARGDNLEIVKLLVERGAQFGSDAFRLIKDPKVIKYLKASQQITEIEKFKLSVNTGAWGDVINLGLQGVDVNTAVDNQGNRLVHILLTTGTVSDIEAVLNVLQLDMNIKNSCNETPLDVALGGNFLKSYELLQNPEIKILVPPALQLMRVNVGEGFFVKNGLSEIYEILTSQQKDVFKTLIKYNADPSQALPNTQKAIKSLGILANPVEHDNQSVIHNPEIEEAELTGDVAVDDSVM